MTVVKTIRLAVITLWVVLILVAISAYIVSPETFSAAGIADFLSRFGGTVLLVYVLISIVRGFTLLPSTPLVIAGTMIFPQQPLLVLTISLIAIVISSSMIYWFSDLLGFDEYFESKKPRQVERIRTKLEHPVGLGFVALWAFFPLVPTDAVCYVAGSIRMHFVKFITAIFIGEAILCSLYVFAGGRIFGMLV